MKALIILLMAFIGFESLAQKDEKALIILEQTAKKYHSLKSMQFTFSYLMINKQADIHESKEGTLTVSGEKYKLEIAGQVVISDGKTIWTYLPSDNEVMINNSGEGEEAITPGNLLTSYQEKYKCKYNREEIRLGKPNHVIELMPVEKDKNFNRIVLFIDKNTQTISEFSMQDRNASEYTYVIKKFIPNFEHVEGLFTFDSKKYPGVEVVDMR